MLSMAQHLCVLADYPVYTKLDKSAIDKIRAILYNNVSK